MFWLAGYQKSGMHWIAEIIKSMMGFRDHYAYGTPDPTLPNWNDLPQGRQPPIGWVRGHIPFGDLPRPEEFEGAIYVVRHPLDVCVSSFRHHMKVDKGVDPTDMPSAMREKLLTDHIEWFLECGGYSLFAAIGSDTWAVNVESWLGAKQGDYSGIAVVKYEDMLIVPIQTMADAFRECGFRPPSAASLKLAVARASLPAMRARDRTGFIGPAKSGQWRDCFSAAQVDKAKIVFGYSASRLGYTFD